MRRAYAPTSRRWSARVLTATRRAEIPQPGRGGPVRSVGHGGLAVGPVIEAELQQPFDIRALPSHSVENAAEHGNGGPGSQSEDFGLNARHPVGERQLQLAGFLISATAEAPQPTEAMVMSMKPMSPKSVACAYPGPEVIWS
jgi:hypothetical protein